jgi:hypothetical protein
MRTQPGKEGFEKQESRKQNDNGFDNQEPLQHQEYDRSKDSSQRSLLLTDAPAVTTGFNNTTNNTTSSANEDANNKSGDHQEVANDIKSICYEYHAIVLIWVDVARKPSQRKIDSCLKIGGRTCSQLVEVLAQRFFFVVASDVMAGKKKDGLCLEKWVLS